MKLSADECITSGVINAANAQIKAMSGRSSLVSATWRADGCHPCVCASVGEDFWAYPVEILVYATPTT